MRLRVAIGAGLAATLLASGQYVGSAEAVDDYRAQRTSPLVSVSGDGGAAAAELAGLSASVETPTPETDSPSNPPLPVRGSTVEAPVFDGGSEPAEALTPEVAKIEVPPADAVDAASPGFDGSTSVELADARSEFASTFLNTDGTTTVALSTLPVNYEDERGAWRPVDNRVVLDPESGVLTNAANSWRVTFESMTAGGVRFNVQGREFGFRARGAAEVAPLVEPDGESVRYPGAFPGMDIVYRVHGAGVEEYLVLHDRAAPASVEFVIDGVDLVEDAAGFADADARQVLAEQTAEAEPRETHRAADAAPQGVRFTRPELFDAAGMPLSEDDHVFELDTTAEQVLTVGVSDEWMATASDEQFPLVVDPSTMLTATALSAYQYSNVNGTIGTTLTDGYARVGNPMISSTSPWRWRSVVNFGHTSLPTATALSAAVLSTSVASGSGAGAQPLNTYWATSFGPHHSTAPTKFTSLTDLTTTRTQTWTNALVMSSPIDTGTANLSHANFKNLYYKFVRLGINGSLLLTGNEAAGLYTLKKFQVALTLTYDRWVNVGTAWSNAGNGRSPQFGLASAVADADGQTVYYQHELFWDKNNNATYDTGDELLYRSAATTNHRGSWTRPAGRWDLLGKTLRWRTYYWGGVAAGPYVSATFNEKLQRIHTSTFTVTNSAPPSTPAGNPSPASGTYVNTLTPRLRVDAVADPQGDPVYYVFDLCNRATNVCTSSGWRTTAYFDVPAGVMRWHEPYVWGVRATDTPGTGAPQVTVYPYEFMAGMTPQDDPALGGGWNPVSDDRVGVDPANGNFRYSTTDISIQAVTRPLEIVRTYNSLLNVNGAFGRGWVMPLDMSATSDTKGVTVTYPDGRKEFHGRNPDGSLIRPIGHVNRLTVVNAGGVMWRLTEPTGAYYDFDSSGALVALVNTNGHRITATWTTPNTVQTFTDVPSGRSLTLTWATPPGATRRHVTAVSTVSVAAHSAPLTWTYAYTGDRLDRACSPLSTTSCEQYGYDGSGRLTALESRGGTTEVTLTYDTAGRVITRSDGEDNTWTFTYATSTITLPMATTPTSVTYTTVADPRGPTVADPQFNRTSYAFDALNRLVLFDDHHGGVSSYSFDPFTGFLAQRIERTGGTPEYVAEQFVHDANGNVTQHTDVAGNVSTATYDANSRPLTETTPIAGQTTTYTYDANGNRLSSTDAASRALSWTYSTGTEAAYDETSATIPPGLMLTATNARGGVTTYDYSSAGQLRRTVEPTGVDTVFTYDEIGRTVSETRTWDSHTATTTISYDTLSRIASRVEPAVANLVTGAEHRQTTTYTYDLDSNTLAMSVSDTGTVGVGDLARLTTKTYDGNGNELTVTDPEGGTTHNIYDQLGNLVSVTDPAGRQVDTVYDHASRPIEQIARDVASPAEPTRPPRDVVLRQHTYDVRGRLIDETDAGGTTRRHTYAQTGELTGMMIVGFRPDGLSVDFQGLSRGYDAAGRIIWEESSHGRRRTDFTYDLADRIIQEHVRDLVAGYVDDNRIITREYDTADNLTRQVTTQHGRSDEIRYTYDAGNQVIESIVENGAHDRVTTFERSMTGVVTALIEPNGARTDTELDVLGRPIEVTSATIDIETYGTAPAAARPAVNTGYNTFGEVTDVIDEAGNTTTITFDRLGRQVAIDHPSYTPPDATSPLEPREEFGYDAVGNTIWKLDRLGQQTDLVYDTMNQLAILRRPAPETGAPRPETWTRYSDRGEIIWERGAEGQTRTHTYDAAGRKLTTSTVLDNDGSPTTATTTYGYDTAGNITSTTTPDGNTTTQLWSPTRNLLATVDPLGNTTRYAYDVGRRQTETVDPQGRRTTSTYDAFGQLTESARYTTDDTKLTLSTYGYDTVGNRTSVTDGAGVTTTYDYDAQHRLTAVHQPVDATTIATTSYGYDAVDRPTRLTDGNGHVWYRTYNSLGLIESTIEPATTAHPAAADRTFTSTYNAAGLAVSELQPGGIEVTRDFDLLGRLVDEDGGTAGGHRSFSYDQSDRRVAASHPDGTQTFTWDERNLLLSANGPAGDSEFTYDASGRMTSRADDAGVTQYSWTARDQLAEIADPVTGDNITHTWSPAGELASIDYGTTSSRTYTYDGYGRITGDEITDGTTTTWSAAYSYDTANRVVSKQVGPTGVAGAGTNTYTYDLASRLTSWTGPATTPTTYTYDLAGNRLTAGAIAYSYDQRNRLTDEGTKHYTWTARGTVASVIDGSITATYDFDGLGRMTRAGTVTYTYDALDRIASRDATAFSYSGTEQQPTSDGTTTIARSPSGRPVAIAVGATRSHAIADRHGDLVGALAADGTLTDTIAYDPFGTRTDRTGAAELMIGFQGHYTDPDSGLVDMGARWYQPTTATFLSRDTYNGMLDTPITLNRYTYANNNPMSYWDPDGRVGVAMQHDGSGGYNPRRTSQQSAVTPATLLRIATSLIPIPNPAVRALVNIGTRATERVIRQHQEREVRREVYRHIDFNSYSDEERAVLATSIVQDWFVTFDVAKTRNTADANGDISPNDYRRIADPENGYPPELQWAAQEILNQDLQEQFHTKKSLWERASGVIKNVVIAGLGFVPVVGDAIDLWNCLGGDLLSCAAAVPGVGSIANAARAYDRATDTVRALDNATDATRAAGNGLDAVSTHNVATILDDVPTPARACVSNSFTGDTPVVMADGSHKPIEDVDIGDQVLAEDPVTGERGPRPVTNLIVGEGSKDLVDIAFSDNDGAGILTATAGHPFWVDDEGAWIDATDLEAGDSLLQADGTTATVVKASAYTKIRRVHNLTVDGIHTYYVIANHLSALVHNCASLDDLSASGATAAQGQLTRAGHSLTKHGAGARPGNALLPAATGSPAQINEIAQNALDDILTDPGTIVQRVTAGNFRGGTRFVAPDGRIAVFDQDNVFQYFGG